MPKPPGVPIRISVNSQTISSFALNERWFATMALPKGTLLAVVQKMLGHERLGTTALYLLNLIDLHVVEGYAQNWSRKCWIEPFRRDMQKPPTW